MNNFSKKGAKLKAATILLAASFMLEGCLAMYNGIMWVPKKIWSVTGQELFGFHNPQETEMGPRRKPAENPISGAVPRTTPLKSGALQGKAGDSAQQPGNYPSVYDPSGAIPGDDKNGQYGRSAGGSYAPLGNYGSSAPMSQNPERGGASAAGAAQMPPIPPIPLEYQQSYTGGGGQTPQKMPGDFTSAPDPLSGFGDEGISADSAYASGGGAGGGTKTKGWSIPFFSGNYKIEGHFEPLAEEFVVVQSQVDKPMQVDLYKPYVPENSTSQPSNIQNSELRKDGDEVLNKDRVKRNASMFPLEQYAPKPSSEITKFAASKEQPDNAYLKLGRIPENPQNIPSAKTSSAELNAMTKEAEDIQAKMERLANQKDGSSDSAKYPDMKIENAPAQIPSGKDTTLRTNQWDKVPLVRRRDSQASSGAASTTGSEIAGALKDDAAIMKEIAPDKKIVSQNIADNPGASKGFFSDLWDKFFKPAPKQVWRRSAPPPSDEKNIEPVSN